VPAAAALKSFVWSSWPGYLQPPSRRPGWLRVDRLLGEWGIRRDSAAGRKRLEQELEGRRGAEEGGEYRHIRRGWCLGGEEFRKELLAQLGERMGPEHYGEERRETEVMKAERIIAQAMKRGKGKVSELEKLPKGAAVKVALAGRLRAETTLTVGWIAERLAMGTRGYANHLLYQDRKSKRE
jgi:hypothetical protein